MDIAFKVGYSLVVAILFVLVVILGQRTFYDEPEYPEYPPGPSYFGEKVPLGKSLYCQGDGVCYVDSEILTNELEATLTESERSYLREQREAIRRQQDYENDRKDYFRNVFIIATVAGILAIGAGTYLFFQRVEAMPLGLLLGGIGVVIYGWVESARGPDEAVGTAPIFAVVTAGLIAVLAAGYWFLGKRKTPVESGD